MRAAVQVEAPYKGKYGTLRVHWDGALSSEVDARVEEAIALGEARSATGLREARPTAAIDGNPHSGGVSITRPRCLSSLTAIPSLGPFPPTTGALGTESRAGDTIRAGPISRCGLALRLAQAAFVSDRQDTNRGIGPSCGVGRSSSMNVSSR